MASLRCKRTAIPQLIVAVGNSISQLWCTVRCLLQTLRSRHFFNARFIWPIGYAACVARNGKRRELLRPLRKPEYTHMPAKFHEQEVNARLKDKRKLSAFLDGLVSKHKKVKTISLTYIFCTDDYLLHMNKQFLNHDTLTDIITFDLSEGDDEVASEIYISTDRVHENAEKFKTSYKLELHRVIFHGALHLCGYKDKKEADRKEMRRQEDLCLARYFKEQ